MVASCMHLLKFVLHCAGGKSLQWPQSGRKATAATAAALAEVTPAAVAERKTQERKPAWWNSLPWSHRK